LFDEMNSLFSLKASENNVDLTFYVDPDFPTIILQDDIRLRQILNNLISNAIKFTKNGSVIITCKGQYDTSANTITVILEISDTGSGIPLNQRELIFEPFKQKEGQNNTQFGGTGLGLSITKRLVEKMEGHIELVSEEGKGSIFSVHLANQKYFNAEEKVDSSNSILAGNLQTRPNSKLPCEEKNPYKIPAVFSREIKSLETTLWVNCQRTQRLIDIRKFSSQVEEIASRYSNEALKCYSIQMEEALKKLDAHRMNELLDAFPSMLHPVKGDES
jgi:hypothetical protein